MFAVIETPQFSLQALLRFNPALRGEPVGILQGEGRRATVTQVSASARGVALGMTAAQALSECPTLQLVEPDVTAEREAGALLMNLAWTLSPRVEPTALGLYTIDLSGADSKRLTQQIRGLRVSLEHQGLAVRIGIGPNALVARFAAQLTERETWVNDTGEFLKSLPATLLEFTPAEARLFQDLGLKTLGSISALPRAALASRLGARGDELWSKAKGEWSVPIQPAPFPTRYHAEVELEEPVETLEPLLFLLKRFAERLAIEVGQFGQGTTRLDLSLVLADEKTHERKFELPEPTANPEVIFGVLENHLSSLQTEAPITGLSLELFPARRLHQQEGLFDTGLRDAPMFYATLSRLAAVVGPENVGVPQHAPTHRPDSVILARPSATIPERRAPRAPEPCGPLLRRLRPPMPATVEITQARPSFLVSGLVTGEVKVVRRPFWANGNWWQSENWQREEWDIQVGVGLYRLLHVPDGWFIEGIYD